MYKGTLTRAQAAVLVGEDAINRVEAENCEFTNRLMPWGFEDEVEFSASVRCTDIGGSECTLTAYYYQDRIAVDEAEELGHLDWDIHGYEID